MLLPMLRAPVPLEYKYELMSLEGTVELALRNNEGPLYIVHFSQDAALASAQALSSFGVTSKEQREQIKATLGGGASLPPSLAKR